MHQFDMVYLARCAVCALTHIRRARSRPIPPSSRDGIAVRPWPQRCLRAWKSYSLCALPHSALCGGGLLCNCRLLIFRRGETMAKLTVHVGPYQRKAFTAARSGKIVRVRAATVRAHTRKVTDVGRPGRTPPSRRFIPPLKPGALGISFDKMPEARRKKLAAKAQRIGEKAVVGRLRAIQVLTKNTNPSVSRKAKADARYIAGIFVGKRKVPYGEGFRKGK